jgi:hypothetical protein
VICVISAKAVERILPANPTSAGFADHEHLAAGEVSYVGRGPLNGEILVMDRLWTLDRSSRYSAATAEGHQTNPCFPATALYVLHVHRPTPIISHQNLTALMALMALMALNPQLKGTNCAPYFCPFSL